MQHLNESYKSNTIKGFLMWAQTCAKEDENKRYWDIIFIAAGKAQKIMYVTPQDGEIRKYYKTIPLGEIKDSQIYREKFFTGKQAIKGVIKTDDVTIRTLCRMTEKSRTSCLVIMPDKEPKGEPTSVMFLNGDDDPIIPLAQGIRFCQKIRECGGKADFYKIIGGGHGVGCWTDEILAEIIKFLKASI